MIIGGSLSLYLVIGVLAWTWMIVNAVTVPPAFATILSTIAGVLAGIVTPLQAPPRRGRTHDEAQR